MRGIGQHCLRLPLKGRFRAAAFLAVLVMLTGFAGAAAAVQNGDRAVRPVPHTDHEPLAHPQSVRTETLWIFDADFEDLLGDNAGWTSEDRSGTLAITNYWHKDTIRINGFTHLGDSTWWCGTYNDCWIQPRGYGNDWYQVLSREFPEIAAMTEPGDMLVFEYDQRYAIEDDYDYGYTDISCDGGETWETICTVNNPGYAGHPGISQDWDSTSPAGPGHIVKDLSEYAGLELEIRFRFESDGAYSSQDQWDNPWFHSVLDGAWQLDNIKLWAETPESITVFFDDCESPGDNGWVHDDSPAHGQTGVTFWRGLYGTDLWTNRPFSCDEQSGWMYAAVDPLTSRMVDNEYAWLKGPPINIEGASKLVGQWETWVDFPQESNDLFNLYLASSDEEHCVNDPAGFVDESPGWWWGEPHWGTTSDDWDAFTGDAWLAILWAVAGEEPDPGCEHMGGLFLARQRVGIPTGDPGTIWSYSVWYRFNDWFQEQMAEALLDSAVINVRDDDGIVGVTLIADNGLTQTSYTCRRPDPQNNDWIAPPPDVEMIPGAEIHYHFEAEDGTGATSLFPSDAPDVRYEFSILPVHGSTSDPGILLVDKHGRRVAGEQRDYSNTSEDYFREALDVLGHEYDVYDVEVPSSSTELSNGPDTMGYKYYDTLVWLTSGFIYETIKPFDQVNLISWLGQSQEGKERNLLLTGNGLSATLTSDPLGFASVWLGADYCEPSVGDSLPGLRDAAGGFNFMAFDDMECVLRGGCPEPAHFDVVQPHYLAVGAETVAVYTKDDLTERPAGVAYTGEFGHQAVTLGFGMEFMSDELLPNGHFSSGASDRVDLMANIMEYFEKASGGTPTGVGEDELVARLSCAHPNPFGPNTTIRYTSPVSGRVSVRVYDLAGRVVATLVDEEVEPGEHVATWDGTTDSGERAASGVYFVRLEAGRLRRASAVARKLVLLK